MLIVYLNDFTLSPCLLTFKEGQSKCLGTYQFDTQIMRNNQTYGFCSIFGAHNFTEEQDKKYKKVLQEKKNRASCYLQFYPCAKHSIRILFYLKRSTLE